MIKLQGPVLRLSILLALAAAPVAALADDYRFEVQGSFDRSQDDYFGHAETTNLSGTWYFTRVSTNDVPLAEAAFLGRASSLSAILDHFDYFDLHLNAQAARVGYYLPGTMFYGSAGVRRTEHVSLFVLPSTAVRTEYDTSWFGEFGIAPLDGLLLTTSFQEGNYNPNLTARYVGKLPNSHYYAGSVTIEDQEVGDTSYSLDFDYYLDHTLSVGLGYANGNGAEGWELRAQKFFSDNWAVSASVSTDDFSDGYGVRVTWRH
jgi:Putative general bacterial porin